MTKNQMHKKKFTLIELLVVITIIAILSAVLIPGISSSMREAEITTTQSQMAQITAGSIAFYNEYGQYPTSIDDLKETSANNTRKIKFPGSGLSGETSWGTTIEYAYDADDNGLVETSEGLSTSILTAPGANAVVASVIMWTEHPVSGENAVTSWTRADEVTK